MKRKAIVFMATIMFLLVNLLSCMQEAPKQEAPKPAGLSESDALAIATEAYIYGYPLVTMEMTRRVMTNLVKPQGTRGPMGQFIKLREYPTAAFKDVTAPNADTLYTIAWLTTQGVNLKLAPSGISLKIGI
jgi:hypothetical protein